MRAFLSLSRLSWPVQSLLICVAFLLVGTAIVGDYGAGWDALGQQKMANQNLAYIMGDTGRLAGFWNKQDKYYGVAFELPLLLLERSLGLKDPRHVYLLRHLVTHGFFLVGGWCCALLVYRMSRSRGVALVALLLFVVQPRLYAHSFFNSKDLPFLSMFMVTLYVTHRAFRTETVGAFVLCGVSVGVLTNLRIMGVMLFPAVLALRGLELVQTSGEERKHVLMTGAVFALAGPGTLYALSPYLWANPVEFVTAWRTLAYDPYRIVDDLFQGRLVDPDHMPWHYVLTWIEISTPPVTLLCGVLGFIVAGGRSLREPRAALRNTELRFGLLLMACLTLPVTAIVVLGSHAYDDWRHVYFLHAPLCCLAGLGMQWARGRRRPAAVAYALVGLGGVVTGWEMVRLHPHQQVYFNALVDRMTPEYLRTHYTMDPWRISCREGLDFLRRRYPATTVYVQNSWPIYMTWLTLPQVDRERLMRVEKGADVKVICGKSLQTSIFGRFDVEPFETDGQIMRAKELQTTKLSPENALYVRKVYNSTLLTVTGLVTVPGREQSGAYRTESYRGVTAGRLLRQAEFDLYGYRHSRRLGYVKDGCTASDVQARFFLHVVPVVAEELPAARRQYGFDNLDFIFSHVGHRKQGKCWASVALPDYAIARVTTGQFTAQGKIWETELVWPDDES